jgi:Pyrimidine dimer DNA glycosylase
VQTFLPYESFLTSVRVLDRQRLGKQRVEAYQLLTGLLTGSPTWGWRNHPAARMWRGHESWLLSYTQAACAEWVNRGYRDSIHCKVRDLSERACSPECQTRPEWLGEKEFHRSHQSNLLRKLPAHYSQYFEDVSTDLPYVWPV